MKIALFDRGLVNVTAVSDEIRPERGLHLTQFFEAIGQRYSAAHVPTLEEARDFGAKFRDCRITIGGRQYNIRDLAVFNDGLRVAVNGPTEDAEVVVNDFVAWLKAEFQYRDPVTPPFIRLESEIIVQMDGEPQWALATLAPLMAFIQSQGRTRQGERPPVEAYGFSMSADVGGNEPLFLIERRAGAPWSSRLYYSRAHMSSTAHARALELLDELLVGAAKTSASASALPSSQSRAAALGIGPTPGPDRP